MPLLLLALICAAMCIYSRVGDIQMRMDSTLYIQKIAHLNDDKLIELLRLRNDQNAEIMVHAENEAIKRGIDPRTIARNERKSNLPKTNSNKNGGSNWMGFIASLLSELD